MENFFEKELEDARIRLHERIEYRAKLQKELADLRFYYDHCGILICYNDELIGTWLIPKERLLEKLKPLEVKRSTGDPVGKESTPNISSG